MTKKQTYPNPAFPSLKAEREYWEKHSPLVEGYEGEQIPHSENRASFLSLRLSAAEIDHLRKVAAQQNVPPGTLARNLILRGLQAKEEAILLEERLTELEKKLETLEKQLVTSIPSR